ncbi:MAG TPA: hypothetical protein VIT67_23640 [Povalibacter sp.]
MHPLIGRWRVLAVVALLSFGQASLAEEAVKGVFVNAGNSKDVIDKAIDTAVEKMNFLVAGIARSRLRKTNTLYERIEITNDGAQISVKFDQRQPIVMPADGSAVKWTREDGEVFDVSARSAGSQLEQTFRTEEGQRVNHFTLLPQGSLTLTLDVTVSSPQLPAPMKYTLNYRAHQ